MSEQIFIRPGATSEANVRRLADDLGRTGRCDLDYEILPAAALRQVLDDLSSRDRSRARRLYIARATVDGTFDLDGADLFARLSFEDVTFAGSAGAQEGARRVAISLLDADLPGFALRNCRVEGDVTCEGLGVASDFVLDRVRVCGRLNLDAARIGGGLCINGSRIGPEADLTRWPSKEVTAAAISGRGLVVGSGVLFDDMRADGRIDLKGARFAQGVSAVRMGAATDDPSVPALDFSNASFGGALDLSQATLHGCLALDDAHVMGALVIDSLMCVEDGAGMYGRRLRLDGAFAAHDATISGPVDLNGLTTGRSVLFVRSAIGEGGNAEGLALDFTAARIGEQLQVSACKCVGTIRFNEAVVARDVSLAGTRVFGGILAVCGHHLTVGGDVDCTGAFVFGRIALGDAVVGRDFALSGASLKVDAGEAFSAPRMRVARDALFNDGLRATGGIILENAAVGGLCDFAGSRVASASISRDGRGGVAMNAAMAAGGEAARTGVGAGAERRTFACEPDVCAIGLNGASLGVLRFGREEGERPCGIVDLRDATATRFVDDAAIWPPLRAQRATDATGRDIEHWKLDGFSYRKLDEPLGLSGKGARGRVVAEQRLRWLDGQSAEDLSDALRLQPFDQLEFVLAAQGYRKAAREIAAARAKLVANSSSITFGQRLRAGAWDLLTGHGCRPWRTIGWLFVLWASMAGAAGLAASHCASAGCRDESAFVMARRDGYAPERLMDAYPAFDPLRYAADVVVPLVDTGMQAHWQPNPAFGPIADLPLPAGLTWAAPDQKPVWTVTAGWLISAAGELATLAGAALSVLALLGFLGFLTPRRGA